MKNSDIKTKHVFTSELSKNLQGSLGKAYDATIDINSDEWCYELQEHHVRKISKAITNLRTEIRNEVALTFAHALKEEDCFDLENFLKDCNS